MTLRLPVEYGHEILRVEVGSRLFGTEDPDAPGGRDEFGIYIEWPEAVIGYDRRPHYTARTAADGERSGPGDTDLTLHSARKFVDLALKGNPTALTILHAPPERVLHSSELGDSLRDSRHWFASKAAAGAFLGYLRRQRERMVEKPHVEVDWKAAMHMLRLGSQGVEFMHTGQITLPMPGPSVGYLRSVRRGEQPLDTVVEVAALLELQLVESSQHSPLPDRPNHAAAVSWLTMAHRDVWNQDGWWAGERSAEVTNTR